MICRGIGLTIDGSAFIGGHPDCNQGASLLISERNGHLLPLLPRDAETRRLFGEVLEKMGALSTVTTDGDARTGSLVPYRIAGAFAKNPKLVLRIFACLISLIALRKIPFEFVRALAIGQAHTVNIGTHNFMDAARVANAASDAVTQSRLEACLQRRGKKSRHGRMGSGPDVRDESKPLERTLPGAAPERHLLIRTRGE